MEEIVNRIEDKTIASNLVYPNWTDRSVYTLIGKLDKDYVYDMLDIMFNVDRIANKYAIQMPDGMIWYQHDNNTYVLKRVVMSKEKLEKLWHLLFEYREKTGTVGILPLLNDIEQRVNTIKEGCTVEDIKNVTKPIK